MDTNTIHSIIKRSLPKDNWNEVISALRQDIVVWNALQNHIFIEKLQDINVNGMEDWVPANLGLSYIDLPHRAKDFQNSHTTLLENDLFNQAMLLLEDVKENVNITDLKDAILIALALREKHCLGDSWQDIRRELRNCHPSHLKSVFVCLFGLVDNPNEFLGNFTIGKNQFDNYLIILHTILSNPIGINRQVNILIDLMLNSWYIFSPQPLDHLKAIQFLSITNPPLAAELSNKLLNNSADWVDYESSDGIGRKNSLGELEIQLLNTELTELADIPHESNLDTVLNKRIILDLLVELSINYPNIFSDQNTILENDCSDYEHPTDTLFQEEIFKNHPIYLKNSLLQLLNQKDYDQAFDFVLDHRNEIPSDFLISSTFAFSSFFRGNIQESINHTRSALEDISTNDAVLVELLINHYETVIYEFVRLLSDLDLHYEAIDLIQNALSICPRDVNLHMMIGEESLHEDSLDQAIIGFYDASMLDSDNLNIRRKLAYCLERIGNWSEAYTEREHILEEVQKNDETLDITDIHALAECAINLDYIGEAIQWCKQAINLNDENGYSYSLMGEALIKQGETESAFENFEKGIQLSPANPKVWLALFKAQSQDENLSDAIETLNAASQAIPESTEIHLALGELHLEQNALTEALSTFQKGAELDPQNTRLAMKLGTTLHLLGHLDAAREVLGQAQQKRPNDPDIAYEYAKILLESGEKRSALPHLEIVVNSNPRSPEPYLEYAEAILTTDVNSDIDNHLEKVVEILKKVIEIDADNSIAHALLGESLAANGEFLEAKQAFQFALESDLVKKKDWFARLSLGMGRVALALGKEDIALASLQEAVQMDPNNPQIHRTLSEVYQAVNLFDNALQSARAALNLAIDDVDTLSWYAGQMLLITDREPGDSSDISSNEFAKQAQMEALNALQQAIQIAPENSELIIKLGNLQSYLGDKANAIETLNSIIENDNAGIKDLTVAGKLLKELGDNCGAIACLEQAWSLGSGSSNQLSPMVLLDLSNLYFIEEDHDSAIETLNKSLEIFPTFALNYSTKAKVLLSLKNTNEALSCTLEGLDRSPKDENQISLFLLASKIYRIKGDLSKAVDYGFDGISLCKINSETPDHIVSAICDTITLTAELYRAILKPNRGRLLLKDMGRKIKIELIKEIDYCCTYLELFIDTLEDKELTSLISQIVEHHPNHPRSLALQSRILNRRGDYPTSLQILHTALDAANQKTWNPKISDHDTHISSLLLWYSLFESAIDLNQWDTALYITRKILDWAPEEPRAYKNLAIALVSQAEYQRLCEFAEVTTHAPGSSALSPESRNEFDQAISTTIQKLPSMEVDPAKDDSSSLENKVNPIINRWRARGLAVFGNDEEIVRGVGDLVVYHKQKDGKKPLLYSDDIAAILSAEMRLGNEDDEANLSRHLQIADAYPFESKLRLQVAITLSSTNPLEAINILNQHNEQIRSKENPYRAIANAYSAKIAAQNNQIEDAKSAIDTAIEIWPNEPRWQIIAAEIYKNLGNITEAIHHYDEAISLEPNNLDYHLNLGKLLTEHSDIDPTNSTRAIQTLERACRLEPEAPEPWLYLSRAYLIMMEMEQAVTCADMAITLSPDSHQPLVIRGEIALHQDEPMTALEHAEKALEIKPQDHQAILIKSQALKDLGRAREALEILESVMEDIDDPLSIHIEYALLLNDVRGPQASIQALEELAEQHPDDPIILSLLAKNMAEAGKIDAAISTAQRALQTSDGNLQIREKAELHYILGKLLFQIRQLDQAIHHLSESIALVPNFVEPYIELGHSHQERRQFRQALDAYQRATKIAPNDFRPYYHAGIALKDGKDYQSSESMLRRAADLAPDDVNIRRQLAAVVALNLVHNPRQQRIVEE